MTRPQWSFVAVMIATWLGTLGSIAGINFTIDPYGTLNRNFIGLYFSSERQFKNAAVVSYNADTLILGSSKATYIQTNDVPGNRVFNAAWSGGVPEEFLGFLRANLKGQRILIGLDLFMFDENYDSGKRAAWGPITFEQTFDYLTSMNALWDSIDALRRSIRGEPAFFRPDGSRTTALRDERDEQGIVDPGSRWISQFVFSERRAARLRDIQSLCDARGVECIAFIGPMSNRNLKRVRDHNATRHLDRLRREVKSAFRISYDFSNAGYSADHLFWKSDAMHYRPETARSFMRRISR